MRFSYALVALMSLANALPTESNVDQRAASLSQRDIEDRGVADATYLAEIDARAEGLKLEERKKKNATAKAAKAAAKAAAAGTARSLDIEDRGVADTSYLAEIDARAEGLKLEERKKKNATAKAAKAAAKAAAAGTARSLDIEDRGVADASYLAEIDARAEGLKLEERKKKNATAKAAKAAAAGTARSLDIEDRGVADASYLAEIDARAEGLKLEERKKKNATAKAAKAAAKAAAAAGTARSVDLEDRSIADAAYLAEVDVRAEGVHLEERKKKKNATANAAKAAAAARSVADLDAREEGLRLEERKAKKNKTAKAAAAANAQKRSVNLFDEVE